MKACSLLDLAIGNWGDADTDEVWAPGAYERKEKDFDKIAAGDKMKFLYNALIDFPGPISTG